MTCIVVLRDGENIILGADRCLSRGDLKEIATSPKIFKRKIITHGVKNNNINIYMGLTGHLTHLTFLEHGFEIPKYNKEDSFEQYLYRKFLPMLKKQLERNGLLKTDDSVNDLEGRFVIIYDNSIYEIQYDMGLANLSNKKYYSSGSGSSHAEGSLYSTKYSRDTPEERVRLAIEAAAHHLGSVDDNIDIEIIKPTDYQC